MKFLVVDDSVIMRIVLGTPGLELGNEFGLANDFKKLLRNFPRCSD
jgi:hypothetical protein